MSESQKRKLWLVDTTLRDGEQAPGVVFSPADKAAIARALAEVGVEEIEVGTPAVGRHECEAMRAVTALGLPLRTTAWCRARTADIDAAVACGVDSVHISVPVSDIQLGALGKDEGWVLERISEMVRYAASRFAWVSVGAQDSSRGRMGFLQEVAALSWRSGAWRLRLADTVGTWNFMDTERMVSAVAGVEPALCIGFHGHNDLGMATANSLAAFKGGALSIDVTVNGLGERAGNAPLEEVALAADLTLKAQTGLDFTRLKPLSALVANASGRPVPDTKPVVGDAVFRHESGIHCHGLKRDRRTYEPFSPNTVGQNRGEVVLGKHSGTASVRTAMGERGIELSREEASDLLGWIRDTANFRQGPVKPEEAEAVLQSRLG